MPHEFEARMIFELMDIAVGAGEEVVDTQHVRAAFNEPFTEVGPKKSGAAGNKNALLEMHPPHHAQGKASRHAPGASRHREVERSRRL